MADESDKPPANELDETIDVVIDEEPETLEFRKGESLMKALRRAGHYSVLNGCSEGVCGACNVMYGDNQIVRSCLVSAEKYDGEELTTARGLTGEDGSLSPVQEEFLDFGAAQCGFCIPGIVLSATKLLRENDDPSREEIRQALNGNICRCTGYVQQFEAIESAAERMRNEGAAAEADD